MPEGDVIDMATGLPVVNLCHACGFEVVDGKCPNAMNHPAPPLGVYVSDTAGATGKIGQ